MTVRHTEDERLGLRTIAKDHFETFAGLDTPGAHRKRAALVWYYGTPSLLAGVFVFWHVRLQGIAQLLAGVAVFTALLFGLLFLVFNTGLAMKKDGKIKTTDAVFITITDLRANVTYAAIVGIALAVVLSIAAAVTMPDAARSKAALAAGQTGLHWLWTPLVIWLAAHLGFTLLTILRRLRTAFNRLTR